MTCADLLHLVMDLCLWLLYLKITSCKSCCKCASQTHGGGVGAAAVSLLNKLQNEMRMVKGIGESATGLSSDSELNFKSR